MEFLEAKKSLFNMVQLAYQADLIRLSAGNFSVRIQEDQVAITPSGIQYHQMLPDDIAIVDFNGRLIEGPEPSSETPMHTAIYRNLPRAKAICHTHSVYAMVFAHLQEDIPLLSLELLACGAPIPVAPWAAPGTERAGEVIVNQLQNRTNLNVVLLRQHGLVALGSSLEDGYENAYNAEIGMETYFKIRLLGKAQPLAKAQLKEIREVYQI